MFLVSIFLFISFHASVLHWNNDGMKFKCWVSLLAIQDLSADLMYSTGNISCLHHVMCWTPDIDTRPAPAAWFSSVFPQVSVLQSLLLNCPSLSLPVNDWFVMNVTFKMFQYSSIEGPWTSVFRWTLNSNLSYFSHVTGYLLKILNDWSCSKIYVYIRITETNTQVCLEI